MGHNCSYYSFSWGCWHSLGLDRMISWRDKFPYQKDPCLNGWGCSMERVLWAPNEDFREVNSKGAHKRMNGAPVQVWAPPWAVGHSAPLGCGAHAHHQISRAPIVSSTEEAQQWDWLNEAKLPHDQSSEWDQAHRPGCSCGPQLVLCAL